MGTPHTRGELDIITLLPDQRGDEMVDKFRIDEGSISRDSHDDIGIRLGRSQNKALKDVPFGTADADDAVLTAKSGNGVVAGIGRSGDRHLGDRPGAAQAMNDVPQQWPAGDGSK